MRKYCFVHIALLVLLLLSGGARAGTPERELIPDNPLPFGDTGICELSFKRAGNLILIEANADSVSGSFILDTGAPHLVLNNTYFRAYTQTGEVTSGGINGGISNVSRTTVSRFKLGNYEYQNLEADMISLQHLERLKGVKILGLIGLNLLVNYTMVIDYKNNLIRMKLLRGNDNFSFCTNVPMVAGRRTETFETVKFSLVENKLITIGRMSGQKLNFIVDTGAETNVLDSRLPNEVLEKVAIQNLVNLSGSDTIKVEAVNGVAELITLGKVSLKQMPVIIINLNNMCTAYDFCIHGMLGYSFLSLHTIEINFVNRKMYLWD